MAGQRSFRDVDGWRGIRFGMPLASVRQLLASWSPPVQVEYDEGTCDSSGHLGLTAPEGWKAGLTLDYADCVSHHIGIWWPEPLGLERALVTLRERVRGYGPPRGVLIASGSQTRTAEVVLEWVGATTSVWLSLMCNTDGWTLHESYSEHLMPVRQTGVMTWPRAQELLSTRGDDDHWARDTAHALQQVAQLVDTSAVPLVDYQGSAEAHAVAVRHRGKASASSSAAFVCWRGGKDPLRHRIWDIIRRHRWTAHELTAGNEDRERFPVLPRVEVHVIVIEDPLAHAILSESRLDEDPTVSDLVVVPSSPSLTPPAQLVEQLHERPTPRRDNPKGRLTASFLHPITVADPATGLAVYLNLGHSVDELRPYAQALLAGLARLRR